jgi:YD repeat-containing protein
MVSSTTASTAATTLTCTHAARRTCQSMTTGQPRTCRSKRVESCEGIGKGRRKYNELVGAREWNLQEQESGISWGGVLGRS